MKRHFKSHPLAFAIGIVLSPISPSSAQKNIEAIGDKMEEVVVTGFRRSIQNSLNLKQAESSIIEAISAEDIGKLPDSSIAESLARLPGLAGERRGGRTSGLSVRGFNENFVATTLNGRELLGVGDNRGVEYDLYPSEIISSAIIYKTPDASLINQGIGGTVDLRTLRPLENERIIAFNASYEKNGQDSANPDFNDSGQRLALTYADKFANDTLGISLAVASMESPSQEAQFRAWSYDENNVISGHDSFVRSAVMDRDTFSGVFQYQPFGALTLSFDALIIDFEERDIKRGLEEVLGVVNPVIDNNKVISGEIGTSDIDNDGANDGFHSVIRNDGQTKTGKLDVYGINIQYNLNETWSIEFDGARNKSSKDLFDIESYSGTGRPDIEYVLDNEGNVTFNNDGKPITRTLPGGGNAFNIRAFAMTSQGIAFSDLPGTPNYADPTLIRLAGPQTWGGSLAPIEVFAPTFVNDEDGNPDNNDQLNGPATAQDGFINNSRFDEELSTVRLSIRGELDMGILTGIEAGLNYSDRKKTKDNDGAFLTAPTWPNDDVIPESARLGPIGLEHLGGLQILAYDSLGLYHNGYYIETDAANLETKRFGDTYTVEETLTHVYVKLDLESEISSMRLSGNIGIQIAQAEQSSHGFDASTDENFYVNAVPVSGGTDYSKILPSLNLNLELKENLLIRTGLSKTISRPRMDDMRPNTQVSFAFNDFNIQSLDVKNSPWSGSSGNPELKPFEAKQFDLSGEWYFPMKA